MHGDPSAGWKLFVSRQRKGVTEFTVNSPESGTYSILVEAHHAKGTVSIQQKVEKVEKKDAR